MGALKAVAAPLASSGVNALSFGAVADANVSAGTGTDNTAAILAAINAAAAAGTYAYLPGGDYLISDLTVTGDLRLRGEGRLCNPAGHYGIIFDPAWGAETAISSFTTTTVGSIGVTRCLTADTSSIIIGDIVKIYSQDQCSFTSNGNPVWRAELAEVKAINPNVSFDLGRKLVFTYATSPVYRKVPGNVCDVRDITFAACGNYLDTGTGIGQRWAAISLLAGIGAKLLNIKSEKTWERVIEICNGYNFEISLNQRESPDDASIGAYGYGVAVMNGSAAGKVSVQSRRSRHPITGGCDQYASYGAANYKRTGPTFNILCHDSHAFDGGMFDMHEPCISWRWENCHNFRPTRDDLASDSNFSYGFINRGVDAIYSGCSVTGDLDGNTFGASDRMCNVDFVGSAGSGPVTIPRVRYIGCVFENCYPGLEVNGVSTITQGVIEVSGCEFDGIPGVNSSGILVENGFVGTVLIPSASFRKCGTPISVADDCLIDIGNIHIDFTGQSQTQQPIVVTHAKRTNGTTVEWSSITIEQDSTSAPNGIIKGSSSTGAVIVYAGKVFSDRPGSGFATIPLRSASSTGGFTFTVYSRDQDFVFHAGTPVSAVTPWRIGAFCYDTTNDKLYVSKALTSADWIALN